MNNNPWFRMYNDLIFDEKLEFLAFEDQRHYVFILCMKNMGLLDKSYPQPGMLDKVLEKRLGIHGEALRNAKERLIEVGLIDTEWQPIAWNKRQFKSDADPTNADRQRRHREKQKGNALRNVTVTPLETETETDKKNKQKEKFTKPSVKEIADYCLERKNGLNAQQVFDHYEANGWMRGKNKIKDWKACVRTWEQNRKPGTASNDDDLYGKFYQ